MNAIRTLLRLTYLLWLLAPGTLRAQSNAPTNLNVNVTYGGSICLQWTPNVATSIPYEVERSDNGASGWNKVGDSAPVASGALATGNYCDGNLPSTTKYYYRVRGSLGRNTYTNYSNVANGTTKAAPPTPAAPTLSEITASTIRATWNTQLTTTYELEMQTAGGAWQVINSQASGRNSSLTYKISTLSGGTNYCFRVRAKDAQEGTSGYSANACQTTPLLPTNVKNFAANANGSTNSIKLTWTGYGKESGISIERREGQSGSWSKLKDWLADGGEYTDTGLPSGREYCYRIAESGHEVSETKCATTAVALPAAPASFAAAAQSSSQIRLTWSAAAGAASYELDRSPNGNDNWTRVNNPGGSATDFTDGSLAASTRYYYRLRAVNAAGGAGPYSTANATTQDPPVTAPAKPTGLVATAQSSTDIKLTWTDNSTNETRFELQRSGTGNDPWENVDANIPANTREKTDGGRAPSTRYYYRVRAVLVTAAGAVLNSDWSDPANATTQAPPLTVPRPPSALNLSGVSDRQITLRWTDNSDNEAGFVIERSTDGKRTWQRYKDLGANTSSYDDGGLTASTQYCYRVFAFNAAGSSSSTNEECATTNAPPATAPARPTDLTAATQSSSEIKLTWKHDGAGLTRFELQRSSTGNDPWENVDANIAASSRDKTDGGRAPSTRYYYRIRAVLVLATGAALASDWSNTADATTQAPPQTVPRPPSNLNVTAASSSQINLSWTDNSDNESGFEIWWATSQTAQFTKLTDVSANQTTYSHTGLTASSPYCYQVRAVNSAGQSTFAGPLCATTQAPPLTAPAAPTDFVANTASTGQINLTWADRSNNETGFELQFSLTNADPWTSLPTQASNVTTFAHTGLTANTRYYYRLRAVNAAGPSGWIMANAQTPALPVPSTTADLKAELADYDRVKLTWGSITNGPTTIVIERSTSPTDGFGQIGQVSGTTTTYLDQTLAENTTYYYRIRASNTNGPSGNSNVASATTPSAIIAVRPLPLPEGMYAQVDNQTLAVTLNWSQFQEADLMLVTMTGRAVLTDHCRINGGMRFPYSVAHLPAGLYILSIDTDQHRYTKKIWIP